MNKITAVPILFLVIILFLVNQTPAATNSIVVHWFQGGQYNSTNSTANSIAVTMQVPPNPTSNAIYFVALSAWDSNRSYDQVGFLDYPGPLSPTVNPWTPFYSWTRGPLPLTNNDYHPGQHGYPSGSGGLFTTLSPGIYVFRITADSGNMLFTISQNSITIWSETAPTGGDYLDINDRYINNSITDYGYTVYEEAYTANGVIAPYNFTFYNSNWTSTNGIISGTAWSNYTLGPSPAKSIIKGNSVLVQNFPLRVGNPTPKTQTSEQTQTVEIVSSGGSNGISPYTYQWLATPPGNNIFSSNFANSICYDSQATSCSFNTNSLTPTGVYQFKITATDTTGNTVTSSIANVVVNPVITPPNSIIAYAKITFQNTQSSTFNANTPLPISFNALNYKNYEASNMMNVEFFNTSTGTVLDSWFQGNSTDMNQTENISSATNVTYWIKYPQAIPSGSVNNAIAIGFAANTVSLFSNTVGEAPQLSCWNPNGNSISVCNAIYPYAEYDNGASIFTFYDNFAGNTLSDAWIAETSNTEWHQNASYSVNNGLTMGAEPFPSVGDIRTVQTFNNPVVMEGFFEILDFDGGYSGVGLGSGYNTSANNQVGYAYGVVNNPNQLGNLEFCLGIPVIV